MNELYKALFAVKKEIKSISTDTTNPAFQNRGYSTLHNIMLTLQPLLDKHNLGLYSAFVNIEPEKWVVRTTLVHVGEKECHSLFVDFPVERIADSQNNGKVMTYARRYNISSLFNLTFEDDKDDDDTGDTKNIQKTAPAPLKF